MPESVDRPAPVRATSGRSARTSRAASIASTPGRTGESTTLPAYGRPGDAAPGFALVGEVIAAGVAARSWVQPPGDGRGDHVRNTGCGTASSAASRATAACRPDSAERVACTGNGCGVAEWRLGPFRGPGPTRGRRIRRVGGSGSNQLVNVPRAVAGASDAWA